VAEKGEAGVEAKRSEAMMISTSICENCGLPVRRPGPAYLNIGHRCPHCGVMFVWAGPGETREERNTRAAYEQGLKDGQKVAAHKGE
jgi:hypothetical protein